MPLFNIRNITINFPYNPYECQIDYMTKVIDSLIDGKNAILESPTGTGKTLCLLCACLAWQDHLKAQFINKTDNSVKINKVLPNNLWDKSHNKLNSKFKNKRDNSIPQIIYTSRTHSQLSQCIKALKKCSYGEGRKVGMIASRDQLCINKSVMSLETTSARIYGCKKKIKSRKCNYFNNWESSKDKKLSETKIVDIEDLIIEGNKKLFCPYFLSKETLVTSDIVFMPYNYILDSKIIKLFKLDLSECVVIFDEAHNIEQVCEDSTSVDLSSIDIAKAIDELTKLGQFIYAEQSNIVNESDEDKIPFPDLSSVLAMKQRLLNLESAIDSVDLKSNKDGITESVPFLFEMLQSAGFVHSEKMGLFDILELSLNAIGMSSEYAIHGIGIKGLEAVELFLKTIFTDNDNEDEDVDHLTKCYRIFIQDKEVSTSSNKSIWDSKNVSSTAQKNRVLSFWCLTPGRAMNELINRQVRNVILTSGTLYPIDSLKLDLNIDIGVELRNNHIINPEQMMLSVCTKGPDGESLNSSYAFREKIGYINSLGNTLVNLTKLVPRGLLVVFPSYNMMKKCIEKWENCNIYSRMLQNKQIIVEPQDKVAFSLAMQQYTMANIDPKICNGAALLGVARGKVSEGLDLSDHCGRGVVIIGLPYPSFLDPRIKLKMLFLDERKSTDGVGLGGRAWYNLQTFRAVNQSLGRVIRHHRDFGAVYLCDERFAYNSSQLQLPHWAQSMVTVHSDFGDVIRATGNFFRTIPNKYPPLILQNDIDFPFIKPILPGLSKEIRTVNVPMITSAKVQSFCTSLKKPETVDFFSIYSDKISDLPHSNVMETSLMSILKRSEYIPKVQDERKRPITEIIPIKDYENQKKPTKRYKLVVKKAVKLDYSKHLNMVMKVIGLESDVLKCYNDVVNQYSQSSNVDSLFYSLQSLFSKDQSMLVRDFYIHVREEDQPRYKELCLSILGLDCDDNKENTIIKQAESSMAKLTESFNCVNCNRSPASIPLGAPCKHICCFQCWKDIIEGENSTRKCPKCQGIVRRKNLVKIVIK